MSCDSTTWIMISNSLDINFVHGDIHYRSCKKWVSTILCVFHITHKIVLVKLHLYASARVTFLTSWWRHQMETFSALLAICAGNSPVSGEFPAQRPVTRSFDVFFDVRLIKRLSKHSRGWWFETLWHPLWRHRNVDIGRVVAIPA